MIGGPLGTLDHPPTKSMLMLPMWQCYPTKPLSTDPALINVTPINLGFHLLGQGVKMHVRLNGQCGSRAMLTHLTQ